VLALALAWLPYDASIDRFLFEDYFYYLRVAHNIVEGNGVTADVSAPTNGFHPLWMLICTASIALVGPLYSIYVVLTVAALLHAAQAALIYRIVATMASATAGHMAALLWIGSYRVIACNLCGLETPIAVFMLLLSARHLLRDDAEIDTRWSLQLGALLGLSAWARMDLLLWIGFVLGGVLVLYPTLSLRERLMHALRGGITALVVLLPWVIWSYSHSGTPLPNSGKALSVWGFKGMQAKLSLSENLGILRGQLFDGAYWFSDTANLLGLWPIVQPSNSKISFLLIAVLLVSLAYLLYATRNERFARVRCLLAAFAWAIFSYYALRAVLGVRYLMPFSALTVVLFASLLALWLRDRPGPRKVAVAAYAALLLSCGAASIQAWQQRQGAAHTHSGHRALLDMARWASTNLPEGAVMGGWNSGIMSYFSERVVVNLDGVINDEAISALQQRDLSTYIAKRGITYLVDDQGQIEWFMNNFGGDSEWRARYELVHTTGSVQLLRRR
jgi:4-amino-4-deoxy-L-arabinose transferase-like glycosyltransferase